MYFVLHTSYFVLHTSYFILHTSYFVLHTSYFILRTSYFVLRTSYLAHQLFHLRLSSHATDDSIVLLSFGFITKKSHTPSFLIYRQVPFIFLSNSSYTNLTKIICLSSSTSLIPGILWYLYHSEGSAIMLTGTSK